MDTRKELGKIQSVHFGIGGYQDAMLGISFTLGGNAWGVGTPHKGSWCPGIVDCSDHCKWTEADRSKSFDEAMRFIGETLRAAQVNDVSKLVGVPVEVEFEGNTLKSWRVLSEVL